jgi:hypothetical protein
MTIQTDTAIVPFKGAIYPVRSINPKIMRYSEGDRYLQNETADMKYSSDQSGNTYGRFGKESKAGNCSLGENVDIYI